MALAIGASTTIFSVVHAVLLKPLPFPHPDRLVMIWNVYGENRTANSPPDYFDRLDSSRLLEHIAAFRFTSFNLIGAGEPERLEGAQVAASFFPALGVNPLHGRVFLPEEDRPGNDDAVVLSHGCWTRRFGADPDVLGETVRLNDRVFRITGVMPPSFQLVFPDIEIWAPIAFGPEARSDQNRGNEYLSVIARMRPGTTLEQAEAEMETIAAAVLEKVPSRRDFLLTADWSADVVPLREHYAGDLRPVVQVLFGAVALVFSIGCVNIANLLLAQGTTREKEFSIRSALGAGRGRMVRQLLAENLCLAMVGGTLGILLAWWGIRVLSTLGTVSPLLAAADLHFEVLTFAAGLMVATSFVFGLIPAMQSSSPRILEGLRGAGQASARLGSQTLRRVLVISEVALALLLLVAAGLLIRSAQHLSEVPTGYQTKQRLTFRVSLPALRYADDPQRVDFHNRLLERLRSLPGVLAAGAIQTLPLAAESDTATIHVENRPVPPGRPEHSAEYRFISPEYLRAMGIPLLQGRDFSGSDTLGSPLVALVDEKAARRFWPGENPIGKRLGFGPALWREVVGMVGSVRNRGLDVTGQEQVYFPLFQRSPSTISYVLHTGDAPLSMTPEIRRAVQSIDATLPIYDVRPMEEYVSDWMAGRRLATSLVVVFATFAILLAAVGIYGVLASWVRQRMHEIGIRMAMGARPAQVFHLVVAQGMVMALIGIALGGLGTIAATRLLESLLFGVQPQDPFTFLAVAALLLGVAFLACYLPARRAMNVDPLVVLRHE